MNNSVKVKYVYCVFKEIECWEGAEMLLGIFATRELAKRCVLAQTDSSSCRISMRKVQEN